MNNNSAKRASIYLGVFMAVVMIAGVFAPLIRQDAQQLSITEPTATVLPTFPPPPADMSTIRFDKVFLHPSGVFSIGQPEGWSASQPNKGATIAQVNLINNDMLAVVDTYVEDTPISTDQLSAHFSEAVINASWSNFSQWTETNRTLNGDRLVIDFNVTLSGRTYVARQTAWTDGAWIYVVRVLVPENATDLLRYLLDNFVQSMKPQEEFKGTPFNWSAAYDPTTSHIIRYPSDWTLTDSAPGRPTSISSSGGNITLRVEARANISVADETAARAFVEGLRGSNAVVSVVPVTRGLGQGFSVAYGYTTLDGSKESGLAVLLNGPDGTLHVADLHFGTPNIDLNAAQLSAGAPTPEATAEATAAATAEATASANNEAFLLLADVMSTFYVIEPLNLSPSSLPATPTLQPQATLALTLAAPTEEATAESSSAAAEATPIPATAEATAAS